MAVSTSPVVHVAEPDELIVGVKPLSAQIASFRAGGLKTGSRELKDSSYDEDGVFDTDPSSEFGLDRFEKAEAISSQISERMSKKKKDSLEHAEV